jgi:dCTP deaminase
VLLSDRDLVNAQAEGELDIDPTTFAFVQPASWEVRLSPDILVQPSGLVFVDPLDPPPFTPMTIEGSFFLQPGDFILGSTMETVRLGPTLAARLEGKSTLGRLGLLTHATAGFIDPGFEGTITLELSNVSANPIMLRPGMKIGQLAVIRLSSAVGRPYGTPSLGSHYQGQIGPKSAAPLIGPEFASQ